MGGLCISTLGIQYIWFMIKKSSDITSKYRAKKIHFPGGSTGEGSAINLILNGSAGILIHRLIFLATFRVKLVANHWGIRQLIS